LQITPEENSTYRAFKLKVWIDSFYIFWNEKLYGESKINRRWEIVEGSGDMWDKIVKYYVENKDKHIE